MGKICSVVFLPRYHTEPAILAKYKGRELVENTKHRLRNAGESTEHKGQKFTTLSVVAVYFVGFYLFSTDLKDFLVGRIC